MLGIITGFVARFTGVPDWLRQLFIGALAGLATGIILPTIEASWWWLRHSRIRLEEENERLRSLVAETHTADRADHDETAAEPDAEPDTGPDIDPNIRVDCLDGREAVLMLETDRPSKLKAQARIMDVPSGEIERRDPYSVLWRVPGAGSYTNQFQDLKPAQTTSMVLARAVVLPDMTTTPQRSPVFLDLLGDAGIVQRISPHDRDIAQAEISVNIFGGKVGRLVHAYHYMLTTSRGSNIVTVRPLDRPAAVRR
jgi:hypothetical protein